MQQEIKTISLPLPYKLGSVNCYLIKTYSGYVLIDTAFPKNRALLQKELEDAGCRPGNLKLIIVTHGDLDHTGNGAYLQNKYGAQIAMHRYESAVVENGDDTLSRKRLPFFKRVFAKILLKLLALIMSFGKIERFHPDFTIDEGYDLSKYGFDAKVVHLPGHSRGSIGVLTASGELSCGDLFWNMRRPAAHSIVDDPEELKASVARLQNLRINMIYPGHGKPFTMDEFLANNK